MKFFFHRLKEAYNFALLFFMVDFFPSWRKLTKGKHVVFLAMTNAIVWVFFRVQSGRDLPSAVPSQLKIFCQGTIKLFIL
jgi:hypothetical protein